MEIIIKTQAELDALPLEFKEFTTIKIVGEIGSLKAEYKNATVYLYGSARIGNVSDSARIDYVYGSARIVNVSDSARIGNVSDSARIGNVYDSARIDYVSDSARIDYVYGSARIGNVSDSARIGNVYDSARIGNVSDSARIDYVYGSARIDYVYGTAAINLHSGEILMLAGFAVAFCFSKTKPKKSTKTATVITVKNDGGNKGFLNRFGVIPNAGKVILHKRVSSDFKTQENTVNETTWTVGETLKHSKWNPTSGECGAGKFHACAFAGQCDKFRKNDGDRYIAIQVSVKDLHAWDNGEYPEKIAFRKGKVLYECNNLGEKI